MNSAVRPVVMMLVFLAGGCGFMSRPQNRFYSLETIAPAAAARSLAGAPLGLDGIELPPGLDRRGIVLRGENHRLEVRGTHQWAAPLEEMVIHTLAFDLAGRLPAGMVVLPGQARPSAMRSLYVTFEDLAPGPDQIFVLDARWTMTAPGATERSGRERITIPLESLESEAVVAGMSRALAELADRLAAAL